jgi:hypothetical protein
MPHSSFTKMEIIVEPTSELLEINEQIDVLESVTSREQVESEC